MRKLEKGYILIICLSDKLDYLCTKMFNACAVSYIYPKAKEKLPHGRKRSQHLQSVLFSLWVLLNY